MYIPASGLKVYIHYGKLMIRVSAADAEISLFRCLDEFFDILTLFLRLCETKYNFLLPFFHFISTTTARIEKGQYESINLMIQHNVNKRRNQSAHINCEFIDSTFSHIWF